MSNPAADPQLLLDAIGPEMDSWLESHRLLRELRSGPAPVIVDTSGIRTGLHVQLSHGSLPACLTAADRGEMHLFMERETFDEIYRKLSKFAGQFGVAEAELRAMFDNDWVPRMRVAALPPDLRAIDARAREVQARDATDYASAALAALLSPCILLTGDKDFAALGVREQNQGRDAIVAAIEVKAGERSVSAVTMVPAAPVAAAGAGAKWAADRFGVPLVLFVVAFFVAGAFVAYQYQPPERKQRIRQGAATVGRLYIEAANEAFAQLQAAEAQLHTTAIPGPTERSIESAVLRMLATAGESMSAAQICEPCQTSFGHQ